MYIGKSKTQNQVKFHFIGKCLNCFSFLFEIMKGAQGVGHENIKSRCRKKRSELL